MHVNDGYITSDSLGTFGTPSVMTIATFGIPLLSPLDGLNIVLVMYLRAAAVLVLSSKYLNVMIISFSTVKISNGTVFTMIVNLYT